MKTPTQSNDSELAMSRPTQEERPTDFGAVFYSVLIHTAIFGLFFFAYERSNKATSKNPLPQHMEAVIIQKAAPKSEPPPKQVIKKPPAPKPVVQQKTPKPKIKPKPKPKPKPQTKPEEPKVDPKPKPKPEVKPEVKPKQVPVITPDPIFDQSQLDSLLDDEDLELERLEQELAEQERLVLASQQAQRQKDKTVVDEYSAYIREKITRHWSRPPSVNSAMEVLLKISMIPGGEVTEVIVLKSSGHAPFDRSAEMAVRTAGNFEVPSESGIFNAYFRSLNLLFKPEDL